MTDTNFTVQYFTNVHVICNFVHRYEAGGMLRSGLNYFKFRKSR